MKHKNKTLWAILFTLLAVLLLPTSAAADEATNPAAVQRVIVLFEDGADPESVIARTEGARFLWSYGAFFTGAAAEVSPEAAAQLEALPDVTAVRPVRTYEALPASAGTDGGLPTDDGLRLMGADKLWEQGYTGDGTVIAVLDTGLLVTHEAFGDDSLMSSPAISQADVAAFAAGGGAAGSYVSRRIPFAYDYYDNDGDVATTNTHGTHVTALAAGYALDEDGSVRFRGGAPGAQILSMKIFPNSSSGGTDDSIILRALEDARALGADVVNISVGIGAGFAQDGVLDGILCKALAQMEAEGVTVCCAAGNEDTASAAKPWLPQLPTAAYTDYGTNCSPSSYRGAVAVGAASMDGNGAVVADYSSRGPASDLHLTPALLAFGGPVASASVSGDSLYRSDYGTSMAAPAASGAFASLLQVLRERGVTDKAQAARFAQSLLESAAQVLTDGNRRPVSPRKQGAGLVNLSAAASSDLAVMNPILELGESGTGEFVLTVTLHNFSGRAVTASLDVTALTDACVKQGDTYYSALTARDITSGVTVEGRKSVTVPAGGEETVPLTLTVSAALRQELDAVFTNGFFVEGFVTVAGGNVPVHAAFMGYCGDWEAAPVLEPLDFRDVQDAWFRLAEKSDPSSGRNVENPAVYLPELKADMGANLAFIAGSKFGLLEDGRLLGVNGHAYALHDDARFSMPAQGADAGVTAGDWLRLELYALRNAAGIVMTVSDQETGTVYYASDETWAERSILDAYGTGMLPAASFAWEGTDASGKPLPGGTRVRVDVYAWLDTDRDAVERYQASVQKGAASEYTWLLDEAFEGYRELSFPLTLDGQAPTVSAALSGDGRTLTLTLRDDQYLAYASVVDSQRKLLKETAFFPGTAGESAAVTVSLDGGQHLDTLYIRVEDYASNTAGYALDMKALLAGEDSPLERCAMLLLEDVELSGWYHDAVDRVISGKVMEADAGRSFRPGEAATRAEIVKALYQANGSPAAGTAVSGLPFKDVSSRAAYAGALCWAYENNLVTGETETIFAGTANVSRQQFAVMLWRCARMNGTLGSGSGSLAAFPDWDGVADWAAEAMAWAVGRGIINGEDGRLNPEGPVTRAQAAAMLVRFLAQ